MSLRSMLWVLEESSIQEHGDFRLLIALAERAHDDGRSAYPSIAWLAKRVCRSDRQVRRGLDRLKENGWIVPGDQELVSHFRADRRPVVYDLVLSKRGDTSDRSSASRGDSSGIHGVTPDVLQTVPSSLREETVGEKHSEADASALDLGVIPELKRKRRSTPIPDDWTPSPKHFELAQEQGLGRPRVEHEADQFRDRALSKGERYIDWDAAFRKWLRNAKLFDGRPGASARPGRFENAGRDERSGLRVER